MLYIVRYGDHDLLRETYASYSYTIPLDSTAIYTGFALVGIVVLLLEFLTGMAGMFTGLGARKTLRY